MYDTMDASAEQETEDADSAFVEVDPSGRYGRYKKVLGKGAFKTVYWAFDELEGMEVAWNQVKVQEVLQRSENLERLYSEVHLLKTLKHKNVIKFYNSWVDTKNKNINFITEIFTSGTLRQYRQRHKHVDMKAIKNWSRQILRGLLYLHSHDPPIIHRDLKCDNIFVNGSQGEVKIGDLGLAVILRQAHAAHSVIGTPEFMAPELYEEEYNELVDIYSFGMCLLEMITFEYPYSECANAAQIYKKVSSGIKPAALDKVKDPNVRQFVEKCLAVASRRLPARELLMHPFLQSEGEHESMVSVPHANQLHSCGDDFNELKTILEEPCVGNNIPKGRSVLKCMLPDRKNLEALKLPVQSVEVVNYHCLDNYLETRIVSTSAKQEHSRRSRDFQVKGKRKDSNTIFLRLRIADSRGLVRNIHFPFDIEADTALSVASEMVAELDLSDQDVTTIAEMIDVEIEALVPEWKPGLAFEDTSECCHHTSVEDNYSDIPSDGDNPSGAFVLERFPSGRKYWSQSPMIFAEEVPAEPRPVNTPTRFEGLMNGRFEEPTYHQSVSSSALDQLDEINFSSESECQAEDADDVNKSVHLTSPRYSGPTVFNRKIPAIYQDMEHSHSEVVKSTVVTEVKSQPSNLQVDLQIHEKLRDTGRKNLQTEGARRASGLNQREFAGQHKTMHECHYGAAFQEGADNMTDPLLEDGRKIAQELEHLALQQQHELEALKRRHQQALQDLKNRLCLKGCSMSTPKNSLSATLEMQCKFPVNNSASFSSESKSERLSLNEIAAVSAKINGLHGEGSSSTKILDSGLVDSFPETHHPTSSRESNIPHHDFGMQALAPKRNSIPSSRLGVGVNAKGQEHLPYNSQDGMSTQQLPGGRSKLDGYVVSSALSVSAMNATSRDYFSSKPVHAEMGGKNGTDERKSELSEQAKHMNCREKSKGLSSTLSSTHTIDANSSRKVSVEEFRNMKSKEMENLAVCKDMNIESVKNRSTFGFSGRDEANGLCAASLEKKNFHNHMRQLFSVKSTGPLERSYLADCILSMETSYPELNTSAAEKCVKQDATGLQCESIGNALKASFASSVSASRDVDKLGKRESYIGFYKGGVSLRDKPNSFQGDIKISDQGSTVDSSSNSAKPKSTNKGLEQLKKQQLQKSIAELEAKTLEGLWKSKSAYLVNSSVKRQSASVPHAGRFGSNDSTTRQQATPDIRRV